MIGRLTAASFAATLAAAALSVSLSQALLFLSFCFWIGGKCKNLRQSNARRTLLHPQLLSGLVLYLCFVPGTLYHFLPVLPVELMDLSFVIAGIAFLDFVRHAKSSELAILRGGFLLFGTILLASGTVALFTEVRLARLLTGEGFTFHAGNRPQHPLYQGIIPIYRPVGFMNTRLTYTGLLLLYLPFILPQGKKDSIFFSKLFLLLLTSLLILASGSRATAAALFCLPFLFFLRAHKKLLPVALALVAILFMFLFFTTDGWPSFLRHTDAYRAVIYSGALDIWEEHFLLGTGSGQFPRHFAAYKADLLLSLPQNAFTIQNTPVNHAHNDLLHFLSTGGLFAGIAFLSLVASVFYLFFSGQSVFAGALCLFVAGLFQCYLLDDEVSLIFWLLPGLAALKITPHPESRAS
ncbi:MAG: O-antigen ligase family protein [Spirochaetales bacterium]|nr:O-antigen ligase family protein [Spirochaetales bacterium]